jgi:phospho-N-acetylmuramoyl-pentapeptide-transferase
MYLIEALSVMLQVAYFKLTKKRLFKMAPLHHHFEMCGFSEQKVVFLFSAIAFLGSLLAMLSVLLGW